LNGTASVSSAFRPNRPSAELYLCQERNTMSRLKTIVVGGVFACGLSVLPAFAQVGVGVGAGTNAGSSVGAGVGVGAGTSAGAGTNSSVDTGASVDTSVKTK
jgi:hypothetical protein